MLLPQNLYKGFMFGWETTSNIPADYFLGFFSSLLLFNLFWLPFLGLWLICTLLLIGSWLNVFDVRDCFHEFYHHFYLFWIIWIPLNLRPGCLIVFESSIVSPNILASLMKKENLQGVLKKNFPYFFSRSTLTLKKWFYEWNWEKS